jgi:hypothetical protein
MPERAPPEECANCGATIPRGAKACPECGADERTGWRETDVYDDLDLPDEVWTDGDRPPVPIAARRRTQGRGVNGVPWYWWCVGIALIAVLALGALTLL